MRKMFKSQQGLTSHQGTANCKEMSIFKVKADKLNWAGGG